MDDYSFVERKTRIAKRAEKMFISASSQISNITPENVKQLEKEFKEGLKAVFILSEFFEDAVEEYFEPYQYA